MKYLIIGNGVAGIEAADEIRRNDPSGKILVLAQSEHQFYYRPRLIDYLADKVDYEKMKVKKDEYYSEKNIEVKLGVKVNRINIKDKTVNASGYLYDYDKLLIATGSRSFIPEIKGLRIDGIFKLRGVKDADEIKDYCKRSYDMVVIGGGLLGIETGNSLLEYLNSVTIVEYFDYLLPRQLDKDGAKVLQSILEKKGLKFRLGVCCEEIKGNEKIEKINLDSKEELKADILIFSRSKTKN